MEKILKEIDSLFELLKVDLSTMDDKTMKKFSHIIYKGLNKRIESLEKER